MSDEQWMHPREVYEANQRVYRRMENAMIIHRWIRVATVASLVSVGIVIGKYLL